MSLEYRDLLNKLDTLNRKQEVKEGFEKWFKTVFEEPTKTQTKSKVDINLDPETDQPLQSTNKEKPTVQRKKKTNLRMRGAAPMPDLDRIERTIGKADTDDELGDLDAPQLGYDDTPANALGYEPEPTTDLATISTDLANIPTEVAQRVHNVEWHDMMDLPGNMKQVIRNMGRRVFAAFGEQDFEDIDVISSFTNSDEDLDVVAGLVRQHGVPVVNNDKIDFGDTIPGYVATTSVYAFGNQYYMFVKDDFGEYVYVWDNTETQKLQHMEPGSKKDNVPQLESVELGKAKAYVDNYTDYKAVTPQPYKNYSYECDVQDEEDNFAIFHLIIDDNGVTVDYNDIPKNYSEISSRRFPTQAEFNDAVDELINAGN